MDNAIVLDGVTKQYSNFKLDKISFSVPRGSIMGFVGENGAGKTTTLKTILNLVHKEAGNIRVFDLDHIKEERKIKEQIGVVFDESYFHDNLTLGHISKIMSKIYSTWEENTFEKYTNQLKLPGDKTIKEFSRGMKMKLSIAAALSHKAKLLILDEATSGLDPIVRDEILDIFLDFIQDEEHTILISSHIISDLEKIADYITFIHEGKIVFSKSKDDLIYNYGIVRCRKEDYDKLDKNHIAGVRRSQFGYEVMVDNKTELERFRKDLIIDSTSIEDIILFKVKGE
ncbi:ABC transporter ATP-binding protein [Anaerocolumna sp. MB42-C2]|uniref:ABC transporter ATP-binding protein n=1 Tax=Anaerocolumna sp. MB42-C2 TaxID=3070997 RepID=UPI0027DFF1E1|nr:ABC transporter ATP-binding protein [Anaerocolumna sp. MB42-C2]WMJ85715.1 ABC transporter ATP-binding protein [Anaerocolumna sp. MB42-C2]